ncbi:SOUL family heme-binding protein [Arthrobacter oryzae]|uniref:SOUL family heme-binding protein n=1 Tax=Arthrobacter oryzae TaxID=409290 RepID=UPI00273BEF73|nr:heme-binding protein [Arthrobacter oryzae]WLQ04958.1 heme-binding protein [Arthrobacter oryzae]
MTEQQPFDVVQQFPDFEVRRYPAHAVAEVTVNAPFDSAGNTAFRLLFGYISGQNTARASVSMTAPVLQSPASSRKLAMTAPVVQRGVLGDSEFVVAFVLPAGITAETAPVPSNPEVKIRAVPGSVAAVLGFSGRGSEAAFGKRNHDLQEALAQAGLRPVGAPRFARFDPPFKPWFLRKNEVVQDIEESAGLAGKGEGAS